MNVADDDDDDDDDSAAYFDADEDVDLAGLNLVAPAHHIERIRVAFATRAKKVDVKKLKSDLWDELARQQEYVLQRGDADKNDEPVIQLSHTIHDMKPGVNDNVTVPYYFICVLHLANEMGLELSSSEGLDDVFIVK